ncbi:MAG: type II toxin-antitoxin system VapC family toxin [Xanthomonadaceae bacterium]|nr:type II toxin-antitoxin system VapC family toxin [Xanthomonadaceae bacterium]MDP2186931.1 type II toxin-antitoxin system VapC family toxin [Xanthomonadales bacterium]MDZ4377698.1 type II toxin-antitoxin system VapC family toxin [Xanthomonadaceae bacterium]
MIGLDTNVLVRYIMQDGPRQSPLATALVESLSADVPGYVTQVCVVEIFWVLSSAYGLDRTQLALVLDGLLRSKEIVIEGAEVVWKALRVFQAGNADFADCLIERAAASAGCSRTMTFDRAAAKACGMQLLG